MNPVIFVLCAGAVCTQLQGRDVWVGPLLVIAMLLALWENGLKAKLIARATARKK